MPIEENLKNIKERLLLNDTTMSKLLNISKQEYINLENNTSNITEEHNKKILEILNIEILNKKSKSSRITVRKKINPQQYQNTFKAYSEILKLYFPKCQIFVLTKIKKHNPINSFFNLFFKNSKTAIINEMGAFYPSYLIQKNTRHLLVNITSTHLHIVEIQLNNNENTFLYNGYQYRKANEIYLK